MLKERGFYRYRKGGEYHAFNPNVFTSLHKAVRSGDFDNAYRTTYGLEYWSALRAGEPVKVDADIWEDGQEGALTWHKSVRNWLSVTAWSTG